MTSRLFIIVESTIDREKIQVVFPGDARLGLSLDELKSFHKEIEWAIDTVVTLETNRRITQNIADGYYPKGPLGKCECGYEGPMDNSYNTDGWPFCPVCKRV